MARPVKEGLSYFPFDVDFDVNEKTEAIMGEFGTKGTLIFIYLLLAIYRKGYFLKWNDLVKNQIANRVAGASGDLVEQVVSRLIAYGTFNKGLFDSAKVLTSQRIQETYLDATKRRKAAKPTLYWVNDNNNSSSNGVNVDINRQSKVNKSKVNKSKVKQHRDGSSMPKNKDEVDKQMALSHFYQDNFGPISPFIDQKLSYWLEDFNDNAEMVKAAMERAVLRRASFKYADKIMSNWLKNNIRTIADVKAAELAFEKKHSKTGYSKPKRVKGPVPAWASVEDPEDPIKQEADANQNIDVKKKLEELEQMRKKGAKS